MVSAGGALEAAGKRSRSLVVWAVAAALTLPAACSWVAASPMPLPYCTGLQTQYRSMAAAGGGECKGCEC